MNNKKNKEIIMATDKKKVKEDPMMAVIANIERSMGNKGTPLLFKAGDKAEAFMSKSNVFSFGFPQVDEASYIGGIPFGKIIEIFGPESSGKSLLSLKLMASAQKLNKRACLIDVEQSFDPMWAAQQGIDVDNLYVMNAPQSAEKNLEYAVAICKSKAFGIVVVDSTAALIPEKELDGDIGDQDYALLARAMSKACKKIMNACAMTGTTCVFINQIRDMMNVQGHGDKTTTPGGRALRFYSHQRIHVKNIKRISVTVDGKDVLAGRVSVVNFVKNKTARPGGECLMEIIFDANLLNPVVKMCNAAKSMKIIAQYKGEFRINKDYTEDKKFLATGMKTMTDLADWVVTNGKAKELAEYTLAAYEDAIIDKPDLDKLDPVIQEMVEDPTLIFSPLANAKVENVNTKSIDLEEEMKEIDGKEFEEIEKEVEKEEKEE